MDAPPTPQTEGHPKQPTQTAWPETHAALTQHFPGTSPKVTQQIAAACTAVEPGMADTELAEHRRATHWHGQRSPQAWATKVPDYLRNLAQKPFLISGSPPGREPMRKAPNQALGRAEQNQALIDQCFASLLAEGMG